MMQPGQPTMMVMMPMMPQKQQNAGTNGGYGGVPQKTVEEHPEPQQMPMRMRGVRWPNEMAGPGGPPQPENTQQVTAVQPMPAKEAPKIPKQISSYSPSADE